MFSNLFGKKKAQPTTVSSTPTTTTTDSQTTIVKLRTAIKTQEKRWVVLRGFRIQEMELSYSKNA